MELFVRFVEKKHAIPSAVSAQTSDCDSRIGTLNCTDFAQRGSNDQMSERRTVRRYDLCVPICVFQKHGDRINGCTRNVSTRGVFFVLDAPVPAGAEFNLIMTFPAPINSDVSIHALARVI